MLALMIFDLSGTVVGWNAGAERLLGHRSSDIVGHSLARLVPPDPLGGGANLLERLAGSEAIATAETTLLGNDGVPVSVSLTIAPIRSGSGETVAVSAVMRPTRDEQDGGGPIDATTRSGAEEMRPDPLEQIRLLVDQAPVSIAMFDRDLRYVAVSRRWVTDYGKGYPDLIGRLHYDIEPGFPRRWRAIHQECLAGAIHEKEEETWPEPDGTRRWLRWAVHPWRDGRGEIGGITIFAEDVTGRRQAEEALRESDERFREMAANIREAFFLVEPDTARVLYMSPAYETIWGRTCQSVYDRPSDWSDGIHPEDRERALEAALTRQITGEYNQTYRVVRPDGTIRWVHDQAFPVRNAEGRVVRVAGTVEDITDRLIFEAQERQTQKMESVGLLAGGIAHDFNNLLSVITGCSEVLLATMDPDATELEFVQSISHATARAAALTRQLLAFSRKQVIEPRSLDLNVVVNDTDPMLRRLLGDDIAFVTVLKARSAVTADPGLIGQVLLNLVTNAQEAMPRGGHLTVETLDADVDDASVTAHPAALPVGCYVMLSVTDSGCGMAPEAVSRAFEPFFTTKGAGRGTGLGLAVVHGIVEQSGGRVDISSEVGIGTSVKIYLPATGLTVSLPAVSGGAVNLSGTETILFVEDEPGIRRVGVLGLQGRGYTVIEAADGQEALEVLEERCGRVDLIVTDIVMPRMDGRALTEAVKQRFGGIKILYTSGYTDDPVIRHGILHGEVAFLLKPYTPLMLLRKMREVLNADPNAG